MLRPSYFNNVKDRRAKTLTPAILPRLQTARQTKDGMAKIAELKAAGEDIRPGKEMLAVVTWGARYKEGAPRGTEGAQPTGLFFIDCDHLKENPTDVYFRLTGAKAIQDEERREQVAATCLRRSSSWMALAPVSRKYTSVGFSFRWSQSMKNRPVG